MTTKKTILWKCTTGGDWQWLSEGPSKASFPSTNDKVRKGSISLPPNPDYWHLCAKLVLQNVAYGDVFLRYFQENGVDKVQAMTVAQGKWQVQGTVGTNYSEAIADGGINLLVMVGDEAVLTAVNNALTEDEIHAAIKTYAPVVRFHPQEQYNLCSVDWFLQRCTLKSNTSPPIPSPQPSQLPTPQNVSEPSFDKPSWLELQDSAKGGDLSTARAYVHAYWHRDRICTDIQFWLLHAYNGPATVHVNLLLADTITSSTDQALTPGGEHYGDWECCVLRINNVTKQLIGVCLFQHGHGEYFSEQNLSRFQRMNGQHIVVYSSLNGHALYSGVGSNYVKIGKKNWVVAGVEYMTRNDTADGGQMFDCGSRYELISAEPNWVKYNCPWGPANLPITDVPIERVKGIINQLGFSGIPENLKSVIAQEVQNEISKEFKVDRNGPPGPKFNGDGSIWKGQN